MGSFPKRPKATHTNTTTATGNSNGSKREQQRRLTHLAPGGGRRAAQVALPGRAPRLHQLEREVPKLGSHFFRRCSVQFDPQQNQRANQEKQRDQAQCDRGQDIDTCGGEEGLVGRGHGGTGSCGGKLRSSLYICSTQNSRGATKMAPLRGCVHIDCAPRAQGNTGARAGARLPTCKSHRLSRKSWCPSFPKTR